MNTAQLEKVQALGFDLSEIDPEDGNIRVKCSCCEALVISGTPCHERLCPNTMHECAECCTLIPVSQRFCSNSCAGYPEEGEE